MMYQLKEIVLNWLATKAGAKMAPVLLAGIAATLSFVAHKAPFLAPYATPENCLIIAGFLLYAGMSGVNYLTTARGFKYGPEIQQVLNTMGTKLGVAPIYKDGVIGPVTAAKATEINQAIKELPNGAFQPDAPVKRATAV